MRWANFSPALIKFEEEEGEEEVEEDDTLILVKRTIVTIGRCLPER